MGENKLFKSIEDMITIAERDKTVENVKQITKKKQEKYVPPNFNDLKIRAIETNKNKLEQRFLMTENVIPRFPGCCIICGSIGSGKTNFLFSLLSRPEFYGKSLELQKDNNPRPYFDHVFLFTGSDDDMYDQLVDLGLIKQEHICMSPKAEDIQLIIDKQAETIKKKGLLKAPKIMIILEDLVDDLKLMRSKALRTLFIKPRQHNMFVVMMAQYLRFVPSGLRRQAMSLFLFQGDRKSNEIICDEFCPAGLKTKQFMELIAKATEKREDDEYPFLHINKRCPVETRYRRNLDKVLRIV